jgi:hypothetical protein
MSRSRALSVGIVSRFSHESRGGARQFGVAVDLKE